MWLFARIRSETVCCPDAQFLEQATGLLTQKITNQASLAELTRTLFKAIACQTISMECSSSIKAVVVVTAITKYVKLVQG